jgi:predicted nucleic acid-binding Zn ribbon protein
VSRWRRGPGRRSQPLAVAELLGGVLQDLGLEEAARAHRVGLCWKEAVGPQVASHCRPVGLRNGVLETEVDSSVWSQQLQMRSPDILAALRDRLGEEAPTALRFRVGYAPPGQAKR